MIVRSPGSGVGGTRGGGASSRRPQRLLPAIIFVVCWTLTTHGKYSVSGDEPHYLIVAQSLWTDGDLDLRNNYAAGESERFGAGGLEPGLHAREARHGTLLPVHDIGVPVALLPVYVAATSVSELASESVLLRFRMTRGLFAYSLVSLFIIGLTTAAAVVTRAALIADGAPSSVASGVVLAMWLSPPLLSNSFLVFPEPFALLTTAWAVRLAAAQPSEPLSLRTVLPFTTVLGLLPWFHRKYAIYAALLLLAVAWRRRVALVGMKPSGRAAALVGFATPQIGLAVWTWYHWGTVSGPLMLERAPFSTEALRTGGLGLLVDRENGLFVWAPIYLFLPMAWTLGRRRHLVWLMPAASLFLLSAAHDQWWGGFAPAGRFLVPLFPLCAVVGTRALDDRLFYRTSLVLLLPQILISAYGWQHPRALWPQGDGRNPVVGAICGWFGVTDTFLPSLRASRPEMTAAIVAMTVVLGVNLAWWVAARRRQRPLAGDGLTSRGRPD